MTTPPSLDAERLAALLDGRLSETQAAAVRAELALGDQDTIDALVDSIAIAGELRARGASDNNIVHLPDRMQTRRSRSVWLGGGIAAAAAAAFAMVSVNANRVASAQYPLSGYVASLGAASTVVGATPWSEVRGRASGSLTDRARAARIGVKLAHIEASAPPDTQLVSATRALAELIRNVPGQSRAADILLSISSQTPASDKDIRWAKQSAMIAVDSAISRATAYVEFARLAAQNGRSAFFDRFSEHDLAALREHGALDAETQSAVDSLSTAIAARNMSSVAQYAAETVRRLTN